MQNIELEDEQWADLGALIYCAMSYTRPNLGLSPVAMSKILIALTPLINDFLSLCDTIYGQEKYMQLVTARIEQILKGEQP